MRFFIQNGITLFLTLLVWIPFVRGQTLELGIGLGISAYDGDFLSERMDVFKTTSFAGQIQLSMHLNERMRGQVFFNRGKVSASDAEITGNIRNASFATNINELGFRLFYNVIPFDPYGQTGRRFTVYAGTGASIYHFNPYTTNFQGQKVYLHKIGTAGQYLDSDISTPAPYSLYQLGIPITLGLSVAVSPRVILGLEFDYRVLFTDYLDDINHDRYPDFDELVLISDQAALLTHRGWETIYDAGFGLNPIDAAAQYYAQNNLQNQFRAYGTSNDAFGFLLFKVSYLLEDFSIRGGRKFGCYSF